MNQPKNDLAEKGDDIAGIEELASPYGCPGHRDLVRRVALGTPLPDDVDAYLAEVPTCALCTLARAAAHPGGLQSAARDEREIEGELTHLLRAWRNEDLADRAREREARDPALKVEVPVKQTPGFTISGDAWTRTFERIEVAGRPRLALVDLARDGSPQTSLAFRPIGREHGSVVFRHDFACFHDEPRFVLPFKAVDEYLVVVFDADVGWRYHNGPQVDLKAPPRGPLVLRVPAAPGGDDAATLELEALQGGRNLSGIVFRHRNSALRRNSTPKPWFGAIPASPEKLRRLNGKTRIWEGLSLEPTNYHHSGAKRGTLEAYNVLPGAAADRYHVRLLRLGYVPSHHIGLRSHHGCEFLIPLIGNMECIAAPLDRFRGDAGSPLFDLDRDIYLNEFEGQRHERFWTREASTHCPPDILAVLDGKSPHAFRAADKGRGDAWCLQIRPALEVGSGYGSVSPEESGETRTPSGPSSTGHGPAGSLVRRAGGAR